MSKGRQFTDFLIGLLHQDLRHEYLVSLLEQPEVRDVRFPLIVATKQSKAKQITLGLASSMSEIQWVIHLLSMAMNSLWHQALPGGPFSSNSIHGVTLRIKNECSSLKNIQNTSAINTSCYQRKQVFIYLSSMTVSRGITKDLHLVSFCCPHWWLDLPLFPAPQLCWRLSAVPFIL